MKNLILIVNLLFCFGFADCNNTSEKNKSDKVDEKVQYACPMDCEKGKLYDKPGQCSICGMDLEKLETAPNHTTDSVNRN